MYLVYKVNYLDKTSDFVSPDDFDDIQVTLEQLSIRATDYYKPRCVSYYAKHALKYLG